MKAESESINFRADILRELIRSNGISQRKLATAMNLTPKTVSNKMNGKVQWTLSEIQRMSTILAGLDVNVVFCLKKT